MDPESLRVYGKQMVDFVADYWATLRSDREPLHRVEPGYLQPLMPEAAPTLPESWERIFQDLEAVVMKGMTHWQHPHFFAYYPASNSYQANIGDILCSGLGCLGTSWVTSPACVELEVVMLDWLGRMLKLPKEFLHSESDGKGGGMIQNTASETTLLTLLAAKQKYRASMPSNPYTTESSSKFIAYCSDQAHSSAERAGLLARVAMRMLETDESNSLRGATFEKAVREDLARGFKPIYLLVTLGTTHTCSFDCLMELGPLCQRHNVWLHIDAAYAGSAFICPEYRSLLDGIEFADTFNFNCTKWLQVNFDCSALWRKHRKDIEAIFEQQNHKQDELLSDQSSLGTLPDFSKLQLPTTRRFRSLKLWFVLRSFGVHKLQAQIRSQCQLASMFEDFVKSEPRFEVVTPATLGLVCFRLKASSNSANELLLKAINDDHRIHLVASEVKGVFFLRFAVCSSLTTSEDIRFAWNVIAEIVENCNVSEAPKLISAC